MLHEIRITTPEVSLVMSLRRSVNSRHLNFDNWLC